MGSCSRLSPKGNLSPGVSPGLLQGLHQGWKVGPACFAVSPQLPAPTRGFRQTGAAQTARPLESRRPWRLWLTSREVTDDILSQRPKAQALQPAETLPPKEHPNRWPLKAGAQSLDVCPELSRDFSSSFSFSCCSRRQASGRPIVGPQEQTWEQN